MNANPHDFSGHPDLGPLGARMRTEWAQEQDDAAADAREQFQRNQSLRDWLMQTSELSLCLRCPFLFGRTPRTLRAGSRHPLGAIISATS